MIDRLGLGTVQFGLDYGIANSGGTPAQDEAAAVVRRARRAGMDTLDTAIAYGNSEARLGAIGVADWRIVTKLPPLPDDVGDAAEWVRLQVAASLSRLGVPRVTGLLLHRAADLAGAHGRALASALCRERDEGRVEKVGVSIYEPVELDVVWPTLVPDLVQAPFNVLDRRLEASGWMRRLHDSGVEIHTRSVFLQGLLLMPAGERPAKFARWSSVWARWAEWLVAEELSPLQGALAHALSHPEISCVLVGVDSARQLDEIIGAVTGSPATAPQSLAVGDVDLLNPSLWTVL